MSKLIAAGAATMLAFSLAACGSSTGADGKPAKDKVVDAMVASKDQVKKIEAAIGQGKARELAQCVMDQAYDKVSAETLKTLTKTKGNVPNTPEDMKVMMKAAQDCFTKFAPAKKADPSAKPAEKSGAPASKESAKPGQKSAAPAESKPADKK
ncbi:putative small lipoprotein YifL [Arcanobacterium wilhelmae]|uniref:Small lipoprotein YifL n=1 Tax=Arcanobacterium wilhelmae TaxID=1803177 RepID=A0ABT9NBE3_9ACTO|nr:hypothetical protein [Arcanobacterium wilhelmae]MDP9801027.1 putative small lipoprotein YifL [Arcanobacterium wilhelmae]WFN90386.1 hypothetical protein P8A24_00555 [Arcanobacterium wilhelmae]